MEHSEEAPGPNLDSDVTAALDPTAADLSNLSTPLLVLCIDVEEEFDWTKPFSRQGHRVTSISEVPGAIRWLNRLGIEPTLLIDYPVLADPDAAKLLRDVHAGNRACFGTQLHGWVNPPYSEPLSGQNSYAGNLPSALERAKLEELTDIFTKVFDSAPEVFRSGRYGFGPHTAATVDGLGYKVDLSIFSGRDFSADGGPDFRNVSAAPFASPHHPDLLFVPATTGFAGILRRFGRQLYALGETPAATRIHLRGLLSRLGIFGWSWLSPEGVPIRLAKSVTRQLAKEGQKVFVVTFHSPSLVPGNTHYVETQKDLANLYGWMRAYVDFFVHELGGHPVTARQLYDILRPEAPAGAQGDAHIEAAPRPKISTIIPTYNRSQLVKRAIDSVLNQTYESVEIIVIDDGSTDDTGKVLDAYGDRITVIQQANQGVATARNAGMKAATGDYIAFLDSDDSWEPWKLDLQVQAFGLDPRIVMVHANAASFHPDGSLHADDFLRTYLSAYHEFDWRQNLSELPEISLPAADGAADGVERKAQIYIGDIAPGMFFGNLVLTSTVIVKRDAIRGLDGFDSALQSAGEDYDFFARVAERGFAALIDTTVARYRTGGDDHLRANSVAMARSNLHTMRRISEQQPLSFYFSKRATRQRWKSAYRWIGSASFHWDDRRSARKELWRAISHGVWNWRTLSYLMLAVLPPQTTGLAERVFKTLKALRK